MLSVVQVAFGVTFVMSDDTLEASYAPKVAPASGWTFVASLRSPPFFTLINTSLLPGADGSCPAPPPSAMGAISLFSVFFDSEAAALPLPSVFFDSEAPAPSLPSVFFNSSAVAGEEVASSASSAPSFC